MLKNRYQEILVGFSLMSLVRGLISVKRNRTTLLIDDDRFMSDSYHHSFLTELEVLSLMRVGNQYEISELSELRKFLLPASMEFVTNRFRLKLGQSPFENLREVLRKFPELLDEADLDMPYAETPEQFNTFIFEELARYEKLCFESSRRPRYGRFDIHGPKWVKTFYQRFAELINVEYSKSKDLKYSSLLHLLGIAGEEKLKTHLAPEEIPFYFFRMLSPVYRLQDYFLTTQLKRRLMLLGGDFKQSPIQYWQLDENKFQNLLLESFEGVISGERVLFFSHIPENVPFRMKSPFHVFRKSQMQPLKRPAAPYPPSEVTFITNENQLGSDCPYRVMAKGVNGFAFYHLPFPELPGSKAEFYDKSINHFYSNDARNLPYEPTSVEAKGIKGISLDLREMRNLRKSLAPVLALLPLEIADGDTPIQGFEYWGPFRYQGLGLLSMCYGVEGI